MKKIIIIFGIIAVFGALFVSRNYFFGGKKPVSAPELEQTKNKESGSQKGQNIPDKADFQSPLDHSSERVTKKPFGIFITPQDSSVRPEKFRGYHTGTDFEIFPEESGASISVRAVCSGKLLSKRSATGYGGVAVQSCELDGLLITVIYGHLKLSSIAANVGDGIKVGDALGVLGAAYSQETSGERKHLHLGFHKGPDINILGYTQDKTELSQWIDPCQFVCSD